jgi:hypothetical protein
LHIAAIEQSGEQQEDGEAFHGLSHSKSVMMVLPAVGAAIKNRNDFVRNHQTPPKFLNGPH